MARYGAIGIVMVVALGCTLGAVALFRGTATDWPDVVGSNRALRNTAIGLTCASLLHGIAVFALALDVMYGPHFAAVALFVFVVGGFAGNYAVFHDWRPMHTVTNTVIAAFGWLLLWIGHHVA